MHNRDKYRELCNQFENQFSIFEQDWWLDIVCGTNNWDALLFLHKDEIIGSMPIYNISKGKIKMPPLTQTLGITIFNKKSCSYHEEIELENKIHLAFIEKLKEAKSFNYRFKAVKNNFIPWHWNGFKLELRYTYVIKKEIGNDYEAIFSKSRRRNIRNARKNGVEIIVNPTDAIEHLVLLTEKTYRRQGKDIPYNKELINLIAINCIERNKGSIIIAFHENKPIAGALYVHDSKNVFQLITGIDEKYSKLNAMDLVISEGIGLAFNNNLIFDFEGSMIEGIEYYFRSFGAQQKIYVNVIKINNLFDILKNCLVDISRKLK